MYHNFPAKPPRFSWPWHKPPEIFPRSRWEIEHRSDRGLYLFVVVSIIFHLCLLIYVRQPINSNPEGTGRGPEPLVVRLNPRPPLAQLEPAPSSADQSKSKPQAKPQPRMMTVPKTSSDTDSVPVQPPEPQRPPVQSRPDDFMSMLEARRAQRRAAEEAIASENAAARSAERGPSSEDMATANLNRNLQSLSNSGGGTGGVFRILFKGHRSGQFAFNGWKPSANNSWREVIDVDAGPQGNIELAMVKRMIELIRKHYQGDFKWESRRLGKVVTLSARLPDSAGLESFLVKEFFDEP
jgi:hypothetical protein